MWNLKQKTRNIKNPAYQYSPTNIPPMNGIADSKFVITVAPQKDIYPLPCSLSTSPTHLFINKEPNELENHYRAQYLKKTYLNKTLGEMGNSFKIYSLGPPKPTLSPLKFNVNAFRFFWPTNLSNIQ